jgi:hypothetical protein
MHRKTERHWTKGIVDISVNKFRTRKLENKKNEWSIRGRRSDCVKTKKEDGNVSYVLDWIRIGG